MIFHSPPLQAPTQTLIPYSPPHTTTGGHHELPLLVTKPPHGEEHFNWSEILIIHLKDLVENKPLILSFVASRR
ncbi:hypothetical protein HKD37_10G027911 [Glycine soja]